MPHSMLEQPDEVLRSYNLWDCVATARSARAMLQELKDNRQWDFWESRVWPLVDPVIHMQERGLRLDKDCQDRLRQDFRQQLLDLDEAIIAADPGTQWRPSEEDPEEPCPYPIAIGSPCGRSPNGLNSSARVGMFLYQNLGLKPGKQTSSGKPSVDQEALQRVLRDLRKKDEHARPVLHDLFHRSRIKTILQRYMGIVPDADGRVRPSIKMLGTETGRFAYKDPALQQLPPEIRQMFIPAEGHVFVAADYSQLEARIAAYLAEDQNDIKIFENPDLDIHSATAVELFKDTDWNYHNEDLWKAARNYAKTFRYGLMYGGKPETLKMKTYCPCPRCEEHLPPTLSLPKVKVKQAGDRWLANHPRVTAWRQSVLRDVHYDRSLRNPFGRKRYFFGPMSAVRRECWNWPIQSTAADLINRAMINGHQRYGLPFVLQLHDELMVEVPEGDVEPVSVQLREVMEEPVPELGGVSFPVDLNIEVRWGVDA